MLTSTKEQLKREHEELMAHTGATEDRKGISSYQETQEDLETISQAKSELDEVKGQTLEEHSKMVIELKESIAKKKERLAPLITQLRDARSKHEKLKDECDEKKANYDNGGCFPLLRAFAMH